jgi:hypothetical protein
MAKELYVGKILTNEMITVGKQLVPRLEAIMPITGSFWLYTSEAEAWRLYIITPRVLTNYHWFLYIPPTTMIIMSHYCVMCVSAINSLIAG